MAGRGETPATFPLMALRTWALEHRSSAATSPAVRIWSWAAIGSALSIAQPDSSNPKRLSKHEKEPISCRGSSRGGLGLFSSSVEPFFHHADGVLGPVGKVLG